MARPETSAPWPVLPDTGIPYLRLHAGMTDEEIGTLMFNGCLYNRVAVSEEGAATLSNFIEGDGFVLPGGLRFSEGGRRVVPGCCSGLEDWHEWLDVPNGGVGAWAGHDPSPELEHVDGRVRIWQDAKSEGVEFVEFEPDEMRALLARVETDLAGFLQRLGRWAERISPNQGPRVVGYFAKHMNIRPRPTRGGV